MQQNENPKILFILAHPDDESFIPSGTIAKYSDLGAEVIYVCATKREGGHAGKRPYQPDELRMMRVQELEDASKILGISRLYVLDYPDGHLDEVAPERPICRLTTFLRKEKPEVVVTFDPTGISKHTDHITIHNWVTHAFHLANNPFFKTDGGEEPYTPGKLYYMTVPSHHLISICDSKEREKYVDGKITTVIDVREYVELKKQAIECHHSQCVNIHRIFKFAGGLDEIDDHEYFMMAECNLPEYGYEVMETNLLGGIGHLTHV